MNVPEVVARATSLSESLGFTSSCFPETGTLLATLAAASRGTLGEMGTGAGVGTAWLASGMAPGARLVTIERDARLAAAVRELFADDERITVIAGDWRGVLELARSHSYSSTRQRRRRKGQARSRPHSLPVASRSSTISRQKTHGGALTGDSTRLATDGARSRDSSRTK